MSKKSSDRNSMPSNHHSTYSNPILLKEKPDFFIIGVQKGGTTSLHDLMIKNPNICEDVFKEKHFFDNDYAFKKGKLFYRSMFSNCSHGRQSFDATPVFAIHAVPERLKTIIHPEKLKSMKFILLLREPVSRDFSYYQHKVRSCSELINGIVPEYDREFAKASCEKVFPAYKTKNVKFAPITFREYYHAGQLKKVDSSYVQHLNNWLHVIGRNQLLIFSMQTLIKNTTDSMERIRSFLGLETGWGPVTFPHDNNSSSIQAVLDCKTYDELKKYYDEHNRGLEVYLTSPYRPPEEPPFSPFENTRAMCVDQKTQPDLFVIGFQRAALTSFHDMLLRNTGVCHDRIKAKHYFDSDINWLKGSSFYSSFFSNCSYDSLTFDATPMFTVKSAPQRVMASYSHEELKKKKFLLILRDPLSRALSLYKHRLRICAEFFHGTIDSEELGDGRLSCQELISGFNASEPSTHNVQFQPISFRTYLEEGHLLQEDGDYVFHLQNWLRVIGRSQMLIVSFQSLVIDTVATMARVQQFLELHQGWGDNITLAHAKNSSSVRVSVDCQTRDLLRASYISQNASLIAYMNNSDRPPMEPEYQSMFFGDIPCSLVEEQDLSALLHADRNDRNDRTAIGRIDSLSMNPSRSRSEDGASGNFIPKFFVLGVQSAATTSLHNMLTKSPEICQSVMKEIHFFDSDDNWSKGLNWYSDHFSACKNGTLTFDATPMFAVESVPGRIKSVFSPSAIKATKFILILREPVARAFSYYHKQLRVCSELMEGVASAEDKLVGQFSCSAVVPSFDEHSTVFVPISFREFVSSKSFSRQDGEYVRQLRHWLTVISRQQVLILNMDTMIADPTSTMARIQHFLGLHTSWGSNVTFPHLNRATVTEMFLDCETADELTRGYDKENQELKNFLRDRHRPSSEPHFVAFEKPHCVHRKPSLTPVIKNTIHTPDFFVIGLQHRATSHLVQAIVAHPDICGSKSTDKAFFNHAEHWAKGLSFYVNMFKDCQGKLALDSTPLFGIEAAPLRLKQAFGAMELSKKKFVLVLEDPVLRDFSVYEHRVKECAEVIELLHKSRKSKHVVVSLAKEWCCSQVLLDYNKAKVAHPSTPLTFKEYFTNGRLQHPEGHYLEHLQHWLRYLRRDQIFIISSHNLAEATVDTLNNVTSFLGLRKIQAPDLALQYYNSTLPGQPTVRQRGLDCWTYERLTSYYKEKNGGLAAIINSRERPSTQPDFYEFAQGSSAVRCTKK